MNYFRSLLISALLTGVIGGVLLGMLHLTFTSPIIVKAEQFEKTHIEEAAEWAPADGWERALLTVGADLLTSVGFASLLIAGIALFSRKGTWKEGALFGLCFFGAFALAPSFGLPPELPGTESAPLAARQIWWLGTVFSTLAGLGAIFLGRKWLPVLIGIVLLALPHAIGAPSLDPYQSTAPLELQHLFHFATLSVSCLFWLVSGIAGAYFFHRFTSQEAA